MHTRSLRILRRWLGQLLVGLLLPAAGLLPAPAAAQVGFPGAPDEPGVSLRIYPRGFWGSRVGVGLSGGLVVHHLGRRHAQGLLTVAPAWHEQVATVAWASANPDRAQQYMLANARTLHTNRDWFYGLGPDSDLDARQSIERSAVTMRLRAGQHFLNRRLLIQPLLGLSVHRVDRVPNPNVSGLDAQSQRHLQQLASERVGPLESRHTGLRVGVDVQYDTRPQHPRPTRGVLLEGGWSRYLSVTSSFIRYDQLDLGGYGYVPLGGAHHLVGRLSLVHTVARGRAPVPYFLRPTLDGTLVPGWARHRFVDSDRLISSVLYRFPLAQPFNLLHLGGHLGVHAASVYDDVFSEAALDLTFEKSLDPDRSSVPLRPAVSLGLHLGLSFRHTPSLDLTLGLSPEGVTAIRFTLNQDLQALRRLHHQIRW